MKEVALALYDSLYDKVLRLKHNKFVSQIRCSDNILLLIDALIRQKSRSHWQAF